MRSVIGRRPNTGSGSGSVCRVQDLSFGAGRLGQSAIIGRSIFPVSPPACRDHCDICFGNWCDSNSVFSARLHIRSARHQDQAWKSTYREAETGSVHRGRGLAHGWPENPASRRRPGTESRPAGLSSTNRYGSACKYRQRRIRWPVGRGLCHQFVLRFAHRPCKPAPAKC